MISLKSIGLGAAFIAAVSLPDVPMARAQDWPSRPVKVIVPFAAAGTTDRMGRMVADELSRTFKQQFYIENRIGGGGVIGAREVARADADGYTLMMGTYGSHVFGPATLANIGYDPLADFTHVAMVGGEGYLLVAHSALGVRSFDDLLKLAKGRTEPLNVGSPGQGTLGQLVVEQLKRKPGLLPNLNHVPYRGGGPLMADLIGNHVSLAVTSLSAVLEHVPTGRLVPLVLVSTERVAALKDIPNFTDLGHSDVRGAIWAWVAGPKGLPAPIAARLNQEVRQILKKPEIRQRVEREALLSMDADMATLNAFLADEVKRWDKIIGDAGLKAK